MQVSGASQGQVYGEHRDPMERTVEGTSDSQAGQTLDALESEVLRF
jgi:hypothetical protein